MKSAILYVSILLGLNTCIFGQNNCVYNYAPFDKLTSGFTKNQKAKKCYDQIGLHLLVMSANSSSSLQPLRKKLDSVISEEKLLPGLKHKSAYIYQTTPAGTKLSSQTDYTWFDSIQKWIPESRYQIVYNPNGSVAQYLVQFAEQNNWLNQTQTEYHYSQDGHINRILNYEWNTVQKIWDVLSKDTFLYDLKFNIKAGEYFLWNQIQKKWVKEILTENEYNSKSQKITTTFSRWNHQFNIYFFEAREELSYHPNGKQFEIITSVWDDVAADWIYMLKFSDVYDAGGKLILYQQHFHDGNIWIPNDKTEITYDPNNNPILNINSQWNENLNKWEQFFKWENEYDNMFTFQEILLPNPENEEIQREFKHLLLKTNYFGFNAGNPVNDAFESYFYSDVQSVKTKEANNDDVWVYPNPVKNELFLNYDQSHHNLHIKLWGVDGTEYINKLLFNQNTISLEKLHRGIYFYSIEDQNKIYSGKIFKE